MSTFYRLRNPFAYLLLIFSFLNIKVLSQNITPLLERDITLTVKNQTIPQVLEVISKQGGFVFSYNPDVINSDALISFDIRHKPVRQVLNVMFDGNIEYKVRGKYIILKKNTLEEKNQKEQLVEGYIYDSRSGEKLTNATVYDKNLLASATTDQYGYFRMQIPAGSTSSKLHVSKEGYTDTLIFTLSGKKSFVNVNMSTNPLDTVNKGLVIPTKKTEKESWISKWLISKEVLTNTRNLTDTIFRHTQFSLLPFVSTNKLLTGNSVNDYSFNLTIGYIQELNTTELGGLFNIVRQDAGYCQIAGMGNIVGGNSKGFQAAGILNYAKSLNGVQVGGILNFNLQDTKGTQLAGILNSSGDSVVGFQAAGIINYAKKVLGAQVSGILNFALEDLSSCQAAGILNSAGGSVNGVQVSGILNYAKSMEGAQLAGILNIVLKNAEKCQVAGIMNVTGDSINGIQVAGILNSARNSDGIQVAGILNFSAAKARGFQLSGIGNIAGESLNGFQIAGIFNISKSCSGMQVSSMINITSQLNGSQIGFLNISDTCSGIPVGFLSFVNHGYHKIELSGDEIFYTNLAFRTGVQHFHNIFIAGIQPGSKSIRTFGYGLGASFGNPEKILFDIDITSQQIFKGSYFNSQNKLLKFYTGIDKKITSKISLIAGISLNLLITDSKSKYFQETLYNLAPYNFYNSTNSHNLNFKSWIGGKAGIRFL